MFSLELLLLSALSLSLARTNMSRFEPVLDAIKALCVAGISLSEQDHRDTERLCEVGKARLLEFFHDLVKGSRGRPPLYSY